jgi:uncharacterized protein
MPTLSDLLYVAWFAIVGPLIDYSVFWPRFHRRLKVDPAGTRTRLWAWSIGSAWVFVAIGAAIWVSNDRSWTEFGFSIPDGWRLWASLVLILLLVAYHVYAIAAVAGSSEARAGLRQQMFGALPAVMPHTRTELYWFSGVAITAGFCEEFLFRGYFIWVLSPWLGWWGAAALSLSIFAIGHIYQGWNGVLRTGIVGALYTLSVATFNSLWPAIALHALLDLAGGIMAWLALRDESADGDVVNYSY